MARKGSAGQGKADAMKPREMRKRLAGLAVLAIALMSLGTASAAEDSQQGTGQPARAVRLSYVDGPVRLSQGGQVLADQAVANTPLFEGAQLVTGDNGKAEIQFEDGSVARLAPDSALTIAALRGSGSSSRAELAVDSGLAYFELQGGGQTGQIGVRFGAALVATSGFTVLRVSMDTPPGSLAAISGNAHLRLDDSSPGAGETADLHAGESLAIDPVDPSQFSPSESIEPNSWDAWNSDRDEALSAEAATRTGAPDNLGQAQNPAWNDLDANGSWYDVPGQGYVWSPYDAANPEFDPYGNGDWTWSPNYGYIWTSGYSWGYLPFQYGMWNFYGGFGWGWSPGVGGCTPWWGAGFYGGPNLGALPIGYRPLPRPRPPHAPGGSRPMPEIPVNRHEMPVNTAFPVRDRNVPVNIAGSSVHALPQLPSRPVYGNGAIASTSRGVRAATVHPGSAFTSGQGLRASQPGNIINRPGFAAPASTPAANRQTFQAPAVNRPLAPVYTPAPSRANSTWNTYTPNAAPSPGSASPGYASPGYAPPGSASPWSTTPRSPGPSSGQGHFSNGGNPTGGGFHGGGGGGGFHGGGGSGGGGGSHGGGGGGGGHR